MYSLLYYYFIVCWCGGVVIFRGAFLWLLFFVGVLFLWLGVFVGVGIF
jgi:hypothetical protein